MMNAILLNPPYMSQLHLPTKANCHFAPLCFSDGEAAIQVLPVPGLQWRGSWLIEEKSKHYCQAILRSTYCKPWLPIAKLPQNLKTLLHLSWKNKIIADLFYFILMWINVLHIDVALNSASNGFRGKDEPKKTFNLHKGKSGAMSPQSVALLFISINVKGKKNLVSWVHIRTPDEQAWA